MAVKDGEAPNATSETHRKLWFWFAFSSCCCYEFLATFSSCCCRGFCCCWSGWENTMAVKDGEAPNVTSETHRKWWFWLLFPLAAAMNFGCLFLRLLQRLLLLLLVPGWENTVAVKEGEAPKLHPRKCLTQLLKPIENDDCLLFFPLAAAMNFGCLFVLLLQRLLLLLVRMGKHHGSEGRRSP